MTNKINNLLKGCGLLLFFISIVTVDHITLSKEGRIKEKPSIEPITHELVAASPTLVIEETSTGETIAVTTEERTTVNETTTINETTEEITTVDETTEDITTAIEEPITAYEDNSLRYMASIIYAEAGDQCYAGQCAVGIVVMNRIRNNEFPDNLYDVIYQRGQFTPTVNGSFDKALYLYDIGELPDSCINAAIYALEGNIYVEYNGETIDLSTYHFFMMSMRNYRLNIQDHYFK